MNGRFANIAMKAHTYSCAKALESYDMSMASYDYEVEDLFLEKFAELLVKECAYLVNHQQRTTGYTTHAKMLCEEFGIEFKDEDYYDKKEN